MTGEKVLGGDHLSRGRSALRFPRCNENIRERHKKDVVMDWSALRCDGALEEGGQEGIEWLHSFDWEGVGLCRSLPKAGLLEDNFAGTRSAAVSDRH